MKLRNTAISHAIAASLAALLLSATTYASEKGDQSGTDEKPEFEQLDANVDGVITMDEAQDTWLAVEFQNVDTDGNGLINRTEYESALS